MKLDVLAIGAHPDDVEISAGGTMLKLASAGYKTGILDLTRGELGTRGTAETRDQEAKVSARKLGLQVRENIQLPDGFFEINEDSLVKIIEVIRTYRPDIILANSPQDRHPDHGRGSKLVSRAAFLSGLRKIKTFRDVHSQEAWRPRAVYFYIQDRIQNPDFVTDISEFIDGKINVIKSFKTQFYDPESKEPETPISGEEFFDFLRGRAMDMGREAGYNFAEGFIVERTPGVEDILSLH